MLTNTEITRETLVKPDNRFKNSWLGYIPVPLPADFVQGIDTQKRDFERGLDSYARGVWSDRGWWWYYGYALMLKEPLGVWCLAVIVIITTCFGKIKLSLRNELTILLPLLVIFVFVSSQDGISAHPRYIILILPLIYIFLGKSLLTDFKMLAIVKKGVLLSLAWVVVGSLTIFPHSLSYFNELAGKSECWSKCLLGSSIEWGQGGYELVAWVKKHPEARPLYVSYLSTIPLEKLGIESDGEVSTCPSLASNPNFYFHIRSV